MSLLRHLIYFFIFFILSYVLYAQEEKKLDTKKITSSTSNPTLTTTQTTQKQPAPQTEAIFQNTTTTLKKASQPKAPLSQKEKNKIRIQKKVEKLHQRLEKSPNNLNLHFLLGKYYYLLGDFDKTIFHLKKNNKTPSIKALILLAKSFAQKKDYQEEIGVLNTLLERHPSSPKVYTDIATAHYKSEQMEEAIQHYKTALQKDSRYRAAYKGLWTVFEAQKNFSDMKQTLEDFLAISPNDVEAHSKLCQANLRSRYSDESILACNRAIKVNPAHANNHVYLGLAHKWNGNDKQAEKIIFDTAKKFRRSILAQYEAARLAEEKNRFTSALDFYRNCARIDSRSFICVMKTARFEAQLGQYEEATQSFLAACRINKFKTFPEIRDTAGKLRTEKKMNWYHHFKTISERCHIVGDRRLEEEPYEPLADLVIEEALPEEFEDETTEEEKTEEGSSKKSDKKSSSKTNKKKSKTGLKNKN